MAIPYKNDLFRRVKQYLYIKQYYDVVKIYQQFHPVAIPYKNDLDHRVKQYLYIKQYYDGVKIH